VPGLGSQPYHRIGHKLGIAQSVQDLFEWMWLPGASQTPCFTANRFVRFHRRGKRYFRRRPSTLKKKLANTVCPPRVRNNDAGITSRMVWA
jgi:hypothetical protein